MPNGPPDLPVWIPCTDAEISSFLDRSFLISAGWTKSGIGSSYGVCILYSSSCCALMSSSTYRVVVDGHGLAWQ